MKQRAAQLGDTYRFTYSEEPQFDCELIAVEVEGDADEDLVFWSDLTHTKQKHVKNGGQYIQLVRKNA